jgi:hypothetical protein
MCQAMMGSGVFDPSLCPLLQNLSPDEQERRIRSDPMIAACVRSIAGEEAPTGETKKRVAAYRAKSLASCDDCRTVVPMR